VLVGVKPATRPPKVRKKVADGTTKGAKAAGEGTVSGLKKVVK